MKDEKIPYESCVLVCVNDRQGEKPSCGDQKGEEIFRKLRELAKSRGVHPRIRVTQVKCLGQCTSGCTIMTYPQGKWYSGITLDNVDQLSETLLGVHQDGVE